MRKILLALLLTATSTSFATEIKKTIQVSATIAPYCVIKTTNEGVKQVCNGYEEKNPIPVVIKSDGKTATITY